MTGIGTTPLLADLWAAPVDDGYREAAASRAGGEPDRRPSPVLPALALAAAGLTLAVAATSTRAAAPSAARTRAALLSEVQQRTDRADRLAAGAAALQRRIGRDRAAALESSAAGTALAARVRGLELATGDIPLAGPGVRVRLSDALPPARGPQPATGRILDRDLQAVANGLWAAGAEAVAVNGVRLTGTSAIRTAGEAILVDFRPLRSPYVVSAIGPGNLGAAFADGPAARGLRASAAVFGIRFSSTPAPALSVPAAVEPGLRHARPGSRR